jgi:hypothetical protein
MARLALCLALATAAACGSTAPRSAADGGPADGGPADGGALAGPLEIAVSCADSLEAVYATPSGLPAFEPSERGRVVRCAPDARLARATVASRLSTAGVVGVEASGGVSTYRIAYRTDRGGGRGGIGSALVYLPDDPRPGALPIVVAAHGTTGLADLCAPSRFPAAGDYLGLPWAARGYPVVAPDYAGLGTEGVQGYGDNRDTGNSTLDAARALRRLLRPGRLSGKIVVLGHSQGGGAALAAQALGRASGADGEVAAVVPFAPGWQYRVDAEGLRFPQLSTGLGGGLPAAVGALALYAYHANRFGEARAGEGFPGSTRASLVAAIESQCIFELIRSIPALAPTVGDLVDETLRASFVDCVDGRACVEPGLSYFQYSTANVVPSDPQGGRVLYVQGLRDTAATPQRAACIVEKMAEDGVVPDLCVDPDADHLTVVQRNVAFALRWVEAVLAGASRPACAERTLPACR